MNISCDKMFEIRAHDSDNVDKRQKRKLIEISAIGSNIPLQTEDWKTRWCSLPIDFEQSFKEIYEFSVKDDDVYVVTFPKCGTTWIQEATWLLINDLDFEKAKSPLNERSPFMDLSGLYGNMPFNSIEMAREAKSPRFLKSHLPAHLLPKQIWDKKSKIVYCARNPKDTAISYFYFHRGLGIWDGDINDFMEDLMNNDIMYSPYWEHLMDFWQMRQEANIFFTTYEEMKKDLRQVLIKLNKFLEKPELTEEDMGKLLRHLSFESMKANTNVNPTEMILIGFATQNVRQDFQFMRRGIVGSYKDELSEDINNKLDQWIQKHLDKYKIELEDIFGEL